MRISGLDAEQAPWSVRPLYSATRRMFGKMLEPLAVMARRPGIVWGYSLLTLALERAKGVNPRLKTLVSIRAAQMIGCPF
ncbi:MAG: hypothetical protein QOD06_2331 [Candidatus Binatota bacterium]|nr:hypothetical protein [Candidatus Binatota bacterium]